MKNPHLQLKEAVAEINKLVYEDDDEFLKEMETELEGCKQVRESQVRKLKFISPHHRAKKKFQIGILDKQIEQAERKIREYKRDFAHNGEKVERENPDQEKIDAAFAVAAEAQERIFVLTKHTAPHQLEGLTKIISDCYDPEKMEEFLARVEKREAEELDEILASVKKTEDSA